MPGGQTILIVDDDPQIREVIRFALRREGFATVEAGNGAEALAVFEEARPDLVILDILMPEMDGIEVCRALRACSRVPIIFLSSRDEEIDRILGLEMGGDDYVTKPFSPRELVARVRAVARRLGGPDPPAGAGAVGTPSVPRAVSHGRVRLDLDAYRASWDGREIVLTLTEFGLLRVLLSYPGKVYRRDELMERAYEGGAFVSERTIDSHVRRIRKKFQEAGGDPIETVHGIGYKVGPCE